MGNAGSYGDRRVLVDGTEVVFNAREHTLLYPPPESGSAAQDEDYANWFLHALVHRYAYVRDVMLANIEREAVLMGTLSNPVPYMGDAERNDIVSNARSRDACWKGWFHSEEGRLIRDRIGNLREWLDMGDPFGHDPHIGPYPHVGRLLEMLDSYDDHTQTFWLDLIFDHLYLEPTRESDPELGNFRDVLDDIRGRWVAGYHDRDGEYHPATSVAPQYPLV